MSTLLAPSPHSFLLRSNTDGISPIRPGSPYVDDTSHSTLHRLSPPTISSAGSRVSIPSPPSSLLRIGDENTPPRIRSPSVRSPSAQSKQSKHAGVSAGSPKSLFTQDWQRLQVATAPATPRQDSRTGFGAKRTSHAIDLEDKNLDLSGLQDAQAEIHKDHSSPLVQPEILQFSLHIDEEPSAFGSEKTAEAQASNSHSSYQTSGENRRPFRKWINTLRRRRYSDGSEGLGSMQPGLLGAQRPRSNIGMFSWRSRQGGPRTSTSTASSSIGFVTAMKSATITLASTSIHPRSWRGGRIQRLRSGERSSGQSGPDVRKSTDSQTPSLGPIMDEAAWMRSLQRRKVLEELLSSEESYVADLKVLITVGLSPRYLNECQALIHLQVYSNLLTSASSISTERRTLIRRNLDQILEMHEELLGQLYNAIPHAEYNQGHAKETLSPSRPRHTRFHSVDILQTRREDISGRKKRYSLDTCKLTERAPIALLADPQTAARVAAVFKKYVSISV